MTRKRVVLVVAGQFIGEVISTLFATNEELDIIEIQPSSGKHLVKAVQEHRPDTVILDDIMPVSYLKQLLGYMQRSRDFQVLVVNTESNHVEVYQKQQVHLNQTADFFNIL